MAITWQDLDHASFLVWSNAFVAATSLIAYPADLLATRLQADGHHLRQHGAVQIWGLAGNIVRREGWRGLWRGCGTSLLASWPGQYAYYWSYEFVRQFVDDLLSCSDERGATTGTSSGTSTGISNGTKSSNGVIMMLSAGIAGIVSEGASAVIYLPADLVIQRLQVAQVRMSFVPFRLQDRTPWQVTARLWRIEGWRGLLRGYGAYVATFAPDSALWWMTYEGLRSVLSHHAPFHSVSGDRRVEQRAEVFLTCGVAASVVSTTAINPLDVARTRLQLLEAHNAQDRLLLKRGFLGILGDVYRHEGWHGLMKGLRPKLAVSVPMTVVTTLGYEWLKEYCSR
jgi:solute carrier family 25 protein 44